jgi:cell fate regulator YaaT (PSP1 superfamily)
MSDQLQTLEPFVVGLRFQRVGKIYHFDAGKFRNIKPGDFVVVDTSRGTQIGQVIQIIDKPGETSAESIKPVQRLATPQDLVLRQTWQHKEIEAVTTCREKVSELGLTDVKIVAAEYSFDGSRLYFLFSSEAGEKADLRSLRRTMQRIYQPSRVEMHLVGPRDVAKLLGGMGACGLENRCCSTFLTSFSPISIKMAKEQGISLTPTEITGMCGRLRCCLVYEYEQYVEARKQLPKRGKRVGTPMGEGKVVDVYPLKESVIVELDQGMPREFMKHELQPLDELDAFRKKAEAGCDKHPDGTCDCGKKGSQKGSEHPSD